MQTFDFDSQKLSRVFKGNWQLAGGHGNISLDQAIDDLFTYTEHGVNVFDVGDIYTGSEEILGKFLSEYDKRHGRSEPTKLRVHTKFVPDMNALEDLTKDDVKKIVERSLHRLGQDRLNLVQFHWWDFDKGDFVQAASYLNDLRKEGLIESIGLTNFDTKHIKMLLDAGIPIKSNQIQFSLLDPRPFNGMLQFAQDNGISIFCYGTLAGGLLGGKHPGDEPENRSHIKYQLMISEAGEEYYENVLAILNRFAQKYRTSAANIAVAYVLQTNGVSSAIIGPRNAKHVRELDELGKLNLVDEDYEKLRKLHLGLKGSTTDDVYSFERDTDGPHGRIMKYNLNAMRQA